MKIKNILAVSVLLLSGGVINAQKTDSTKLSDTRTIESFHTLKVGDDFNVEITQGAPSVKLVAENGDLKEIETEVKNGVLTISQSKKFKNPKRLKIVASSPDIKKIEVSDAAEVTSSSFIKGDNFEIKADGASEVKLSLMVNTLKSEISGAAEVKLIGEAQTHNLDLNGAGELKALDLITQKTNAEITGAGSAKINAKQEINAKISGAGGISYKEEPAIKNIEITSAGTIESLSEKSKDGDEEKEKDNDTTKLKLGEYRIQIFEDKHFKKSKAQKDTLSETKTKSKINHSWAGLELGVNGLLNADNKMTMPNGYKFLDQNYGKSFNWSLNLFDTDINIYKEQVNIVTGLGFEFAHYDFKNKISLMPDTNKLAAQANNGPNYKQNKLNVTYITAPLLLEFNTSSNAKKAFRISTGVIFAYKLGSNTRQEFSLNGSDYKVKVRDEYNLAPFKASATVRMGYRNFSVFANYGLTQIFQSSAAPKIYPFTVGITLIPF